MDRIQRLRRLSAPARVAIQIVLTVAFPVLVFYGLLDRLQEGIRSAFFLAWCDLRNDWATLKSIWRA